MYSELPLMDASLYTRTFAAWNNLVEHRQSIEFSCSSEIEDCMYFAACVNFILNSKDLIITHHIST